MPAPVDAFRQCGYSFLPGIVAGNELAALMTWARTMDAPGGPVEADGQVAGARSFYAPAVTEFLLAKLAPVVEEATGAPVYPTYSYMRIYKAGSVLARHTDRPACEFTLSLALGCESPRPWPIGLETAAGPRTFEMESGDGLLFRGCDLPHWRDAFAGSYCAQAFLHYVDRRGPAAGEKFDGRPAIGAPLSGARPTNAG